MMAALVIVAVIGLGGYFGVKKCRQVRATKKDQNPGSPSHFPVDETSNDEPKAVGKNGDIPVSLFDEFESERVESHFEIGKPYEADV